MQKDEGLRLLVYADCMIIVGLSGKKHMTYPIYRERPFPDDLCQGDILDPECLLENLKGHQDYFAERKRFYRYMVVTQTCDLARRKEQMTKVTEFILLAVIRRLSEVLDRRYTEKRRGEKRNDRTDRLLHDLLNHNYNRRGLFYLPIDEKQGIDEDSVVDLRVVFSLHKAHYRDLLSSRRGALTDVYSAQLGHMIGYMYSRIATPGWEELGQNRDIGEVVRSLMKVIEDREEEHFKQLHARSIDGKCAFSQCDHEGKTYRWLRVAAINGEPEYQEHIVCFQHAEQHDNGDLPERSTIRSVLWKAGQEQGQTGTGTVLRIMNAKAQQTGVR